MRAHLLLVLIVACGLLVPALAEATVRWTSCTDKLCRNCLGNQTVNGCFPNPADGTSDMYWCTQQNRYVQQDHYADSVSCGTKPTYSPLYPVGECTAKDGTTGLFYRYDCIAEPECVIRGVDWTASRVLVFRTAQQPGDGVVYDWATNLCANVTDLCPKTPAYVQQQEVETGICNKQWTVRTGVSTGPQWAQFMFQDLVDPSTITFTVQCDPTAVDLRAAPEKINVTYIGGSWHYNATLYSNLPCSYN